MKVGIDVGIYGALATPENVLNLTRFAEEHDYHSLWLADHVIFPSRITSRYPYSPTGEFPALNTDPLLEPIATMGVLAGATKTIKIGTAVLVIPYRNPVVLGRMLATLDVFSGGRIILGAGSGWLEEEFKSLQTTDFRLRGPVTDEYLDIIKIVSAGGEVSYEGEHYKFDSIKCYPGSIQRPHPQILIGGVSNRALRRAAEMGDGWLSVSLTSDQIPERLDLLARLCGKYDRRIEDLWLTHKLFISIGKAQPDLVGGRKMGTGTPKEITDDLKLLQDLGYQSVIFRYPDFDVDEQTRQFSVLADEIMPRL